MARAHAAVLEQPFAGVKQAMGATAEAISEGAQTTARVTSKAVYGTFYYTSFGVTYVLLTAFSVLLIGNNPLGRGIRDGAVAAGKVKGGKRTRK